jgi:Big-like domain-containing protein/glycine rich protein/pentapeptide repeat protein
MRERTWLRWLRNGVGGGGRLSLVRLLMVASVVALGMAGTVALVGARLVYAAPISCATETVGGVQVTPTPTTVNGVATCVYTYPSGQGEQSFTVPSGVTRLNITATGGAGAEAVIQGQHVAFGGRGATVSAMIPAPASGATLYVEVGGNGGGNGSGSPGNYVPGSYAGFGGGASDVRTDSKADTSTNANGVSNSLLSRLIVAGGGGGAGTAGAGGDAIPSPNSYNGNGGVGGYLPGYGYTGGGGSGGTQSAGGAGGAASAANPACPFGASGGAGSFGVGGNGGNCYGGGGGGGYYGGGGGGGDPEYGGGGGAGSSYVTSSALTASTSSDTTNTPQVVISYTNQQLSTTTVTSSQNPSLIGQSVTFTATVGAVNSGSGTPGGTVTFTSGATTLCSNVALSSSGVATCAASLGGGGNSVTASYSGDTDFFGSSGSLTQQVNAYSPTLTSSANPATAGIGAPLNDSATLSGGDSPNGFITFTLWAPGLGSFPGCTGRVCKPPVYSDTVNVTGNGVYSTTTGSNPGGYAATTQGTYQWSVSYSGDAWNYGTETGFGSDPVTVGPASTTTSLAVTSPTQPSGLPAGTAVSFAGQTVTFTASISPAPDGGAVTFQDGATTLCSNVALSGGKATCKATYAATGQHSITASYNGDSNYTSSSTSLTLYVDTDISRYLKNGVYDLRNVNLSGGYFGGENLSGADLSDGNFSGANFSHANLSGANLSNGNFSNANFTGATLTNANLTQTNLIGATGLTPGQVGGVTWFKTTCPDNTTSSKDPGGSCGPYDLNP